MMIPKTKIIATLGPASSSETVLRKMFISGLDIVRLNFSHGSCEEHIHRISLVRELNKKMHRGIKIMQDLEGYRIRVGRLKNKEVFLKDKHIVFLTNRKIVGDERGFSFDYPDTLSGIKKGSLIFIDDGKISLRVISVSESSIKARVVSGGVLKERKGINIPGINLNFPSITKKDRKDMVVFRDYRLDFLALSFVRNAQDIVSFQKVLNPQKWGGKLFAKVENMLALENIDDIIDVADGVIIARGDLGICVPIYKVPIIQKEIIKKCLHKNKPVVVATQMLDSMMRNPLPTRAEVNDVVNSILDGATHLLLSGETAVGKYPAQVVDMMNRIIKYTERYMKMNKR